METNFLKVTLNRREHHAVGVYSSRLTQVAPPPIPIICCCFGFGENPKRDVKPSARDSDVLKLPCRAVYIYDQSRSISSPLLGTPSFPSVDWWELRSAFTKKLILHADALCLCWDKIVPMKAIKTTAARGAAQVIINRSSRWKWEMIFTIQPLYPRERAPVTH